jgi:hypothetical protein
LRFEKILSVYLYYSINYTTVNLVRVHARGDTRIDKSRNSNLVEGRYEWDDQSR